VTEVSFDEVMVGPHTGRELRYTSRAPDAGLGEGRLRTVLVDRRLFVFHVLARSAAGRGQAQRFLAGLEVEAARE
jgi:hypothetical protein